MLKNSLFKHVVLYGANSDLGLSIIRQLPLSSESRLTLIGRHQKNLVANLPRVEAVEYYQHDLLNIPSYEDLRTYFNSLESVDLIIVASGTLPEENNDLDYSSVLHSVNVNTSGACAILSLSAECLLKNEGGRLLFISSVAGMRPRLRNFEYGAGKAGTDFFAMGLALKYRHKNLFVTVLRPGYVYTKMSAKFRPAPFAITSDQVGRIAVRAILAKKRIEYAPRKLAIIMNLAILTPRNLFNRLG
jgi:decaprenylphospho-beta-D-erythro-pentofuranosid-2-ulose 2-reductase